MGEASNISWTDHTFNPWIGCQRVSEGCRHCYAETLNARYGWAKWGPRGTRSVTSPANWRKPLTWNRAAQAAGIPARVFCGSLCDVFEDHPDAFEPRVRLWGLIRQTPWLQWQLLTKRPDLIAGYLPSDWGIGWTNVWLGTSIEDARVIGRADLLRNTFAAVRFISYEPALGPLDDLDLTGIHWVIYGGESGPDFRPDNREWASAMRRKCARAGVAFFYKQGAALRPQANPTLDGETVHEWPAAFA